MIHQSFQPGHLHQSLRYPFWGITIHTLRRIEFAWRSVPRNCNPRLFFCSRFHQASGASVSGLPESFRQRTFHQRIVVVTQDSEGGNPRMPRLPHSGSPAVDQNRVGAGSYCTQRHRMFALLQRDMHAVPQSN